jgi:signal transduction histidine kinase
MKKTILISLLYFFPIIWSLSASGQSSRIDSLYKQLNLNNENNLKQINLLLVIAEAQELSNPEKGIEAVNKAIELAQKLNKEPELATAYNQKTRLLIMKQLSAEADITLKESIALNQKLKNQHQLAENDLTAAQFIFCQRKSDNTINYIDKSFNHFKKSGNNFVLGKIYLFYGVHYVFFNTDTALVFYLKAKSNFEKCGRKDWLAFTNLNIATNYTSLNENANALKYFKIAEDLNRTVRSDLIAENIYCTKGYLYFSLGDFPKAIDNFIPGLKIAEQINDEMMQASLLGNLGSVFGSIKDYKKSVEYLNRQIAIAKKINDGYTLSSGYKNLGWIEYENQHYIEALKYFKMALEVALTINQFDSMAECYGAIGDANEKLGNYNEAFINIYKALELNRKQGNFYNIGDNLLALSRTILNAGNNKIKDVIGGTLDVKTKREKAIEFSLEALKIAEEKNTLTLKRDALKQLSNLYNLTGNEEKAFSYFKQYVVAKDSIMSSDNINSINSLQLKFETEKKEQQIKLLNTDNVIKEKEISEKKTQRNGFIVGFALLLLIGVVAFNRYQVKQKANKQLSLALAQLKEAQQQLIEQEKLASLGQLTAGIAHEIQNPLNFVINFSQLSEGLFEDLNSNDETLKMDTIADLEDNLNIIEKHGKRAEAIIQSMLMHARSKETKIHKGNLNSICKDAIQFSWQAMEHKYPNFICKRELLLDELLPNVNIVEQDIARVIINLFNNALYAVHEKKLTNETALSYEPQIRIRTLQNDQYVFLYVTDNGNGIPQEIRNKIFQPFFTTKPTNLGTGLGLSISYDIVKTHGGTLSLDNTSSEGTTFEMRLPV